MGVLFHFMGEICTMHHTNPPLLHMYPDAVISPAYKCIDIPQGNQSLKSIPTHDYKNICIL